MSNFFAVGQWHHTQGIEKCRCGIYVRDSSVLKVSDEDPRDFSAPEQIASCFPQAANPSKLHIDATIVAANRSIELQTENKDLHDEIGGMELTIADLRKKLEEHELLFAWAKEREDFTEKLLEGLALHLPVGTPRTVDGIVDEVAKTYLALDAHEDASTPAFDEIAALCGCAEWEYPGQVIRDVERVVKQRDGLQTELRDVILVRDKLQADTVWLRSAWETEISKNNELRSALRVAEAVREDARASSQKYLDEKREAIQCRDQLQRMLDRSEALRTAQPTTDDIATIHADLSKQKDDAYAERDRCVAGLAAIAVRLGWSAWLGKHVGDPWDHDWRWIVFINLPTGQVSWHIHDSEVQWFGFLTYRPKKPWDGHTTEQKYDRLALLARQASHYERGDQLPSLNNYQRHALRCVRDFTRSRLLDPDDRNRCDQGLAWLDVMLDGKTAELEAGSSEPCLAHTFVGDVCRDCGLQAPRHVDGVRVEESEHDQYDRATGDLGRPLVFDGVSDREHRPLAEHLPTHTCGCSPKYVELAPGVHAGYCALAGQPLDDGRKRWRCEPCKVTLRAGIGEPDVTSCIQCGQPTTAVTT